MFRSNGTPGPASSATSLISTSPRKTVPLNPGDDSWPGPSGGRAVPTVTKRAFFCGVVVEGPNDGMDLSEDVQDLVASLGDEIASDKDYEDSSVPSTSAREAQSYTRPRALTNTSALADLINEFVATERTYVQRLRILKKSYADPLRSYAKSKDTEIIPAYRARILFGNIDQLLPANEAFLQDLELMLEGKHPLGGVGDIALHHFKDLRTFDCYNKYYANRTEAQNIYKMETAKKSSAGFAAHIEKIKYTTSDSKNKVGLRELLMEPVQRVPRYTLLFRAMIKLMAPSDPQRDRLVEADEIASRIALAETDENTRLAATLNCLSASIENFPPSLYYAGRRFIDCIDVVDNLAEAAGMDPFGSISSSGTGSSSTSGASGSHANLYCTLFLFDDKLLIAKRPNSDKAGRTLAGLDDVERFASSALTSGRGRGLSSIRRGGLNFKGMVEITDIVATDQSGVDMHLYLEDPPLDQSDRWSGRPFRVLSTVIPGTGNLDVARTEGEKKRFLENLWRAQARYRTREGKSVALCADEQRVEARGGKITIARTYFNVYQRTTFLAEPERRKTKVVLHIDSLGNADPLPCEMHSPPYVVIRVRPLSEGRCEYSILSSDPDDEPEEFEIETARIPSQVVQTIHQFGLFKFRTNNPSRPATPSGGNRSRVHKFGLDVLARNFFGGASKHHNAFGNGSIGSSHRRSKSAISRSSTVLTDTTATSTTMDSVLQSTLRSNSTAATSMSSFAAAADGSLGKRNGRSRKLVKRSRSRSPGASLMSNENGSEYHLDGERTPGSMSRRRARSVSLPREDSLEYSDHDEDTELFDMEMRLRHRKTDSERALSMNLALAHRNSLKQNEKTTLNAYSVMDIPVEETIYEDEPPPPTARPSSRASRSTYTVRDTGPSRDALSVRSTTPTPHSRGGRSLSRDRPKGPRSPSPLPMTSPSISSMHLDIETALENMSPERPARPELRPQEGYHSRHGSGHGIGGLGLSVASTYSDEDATSSSTAIGTPTQLPRTKRLPLIGAESTPKAPLKTSNPLPVTPKANEADAGTATIVPLSIKKKLPGAPGGTPAASTTLAMRRPYAPNSPLAKAKRSLPPEERFASSRLQRADSLSTGAEPVYPDEEQGRSLVRLVETTKEDIESSRRALKRIKLEVNTMPSRISEHRPSTPTRGLRRTPTRSNTAANPGVREAQVRMEEMRALIGQRIGGPVFASGIPRARPLSVVEGSLSESHSSGSEDNYTFEQAELQAWTKSADELVTGAERDLSRAVSNMEQLEAEAKRYYSLAKERWLESERYRTKVRSWERQCELVKRLLQDSTEENEIMYEAFNEELEGMFEMVKLPQEEAWTALTANLRETKEERNRLRSENAALKRGLEEAEMQRDEWATLLRQHKLIE